MSTYSFTYCLPPTASGLNNRKWFWLLPPDMFGKARSIPLSPALSLRERAGVRGIDRAFPNMSGGSNQNHFRLFNPEAVGGRQYVNEYVLIITRLSLRSRRHNRKVKYEKQSNLPAWIHAGGNHDRSGHHRN